MPRRKATGDAAHTDAAGAGVSAPDSKPETQFVIVTTTAASNSKRVDPATRKQIRSHVMRGKNRKHRPAGDSAPLGSWISQSVSLQKAEAACPIIPQRVGNDMSHIPFAGDMKPYMVELTFKWFTILKQAMYPVEACVQPGGQQWVEYLSYDRAYVHSVLFAAEAVFDYLHNGRFGVKTLRHLNPTLSTLRRRLLDDSVATSDSTISTVLTLAMLADILGDPDAAEKHMEGLHRLVTLRGGIQGLSHNTELQAKVLRADLGAALNKGTAPLFFTSGFSWDPYLTISSSSSSTPPSSTTPLTRLKSSILAQIPDPRLRNTLLDLQEFSLAANLAFQTKRKIPAHLFRETLVSAQYRLLALLREYDGSDDRQGSGCKSGGGEEEEEEVKMVLCLGMLAFTTMTFCQIRELPMRFGYLARRVRECVQGIGSIKRGKGGESVEGKRLWLWVLFVARVSVLDGVEDEELLVGAAKGVVEGLGLEGKAWGEVREVLRGFMWIDWIHPKKGQVFWGMLGSG